jgi:hypothetical protein
MTYEEIEAEATRIVASSRQAPAPHAKAVLAAFMQFTCGLAVTEYCPYCDGLLSVSRLLTEAWSIACPCGRTHDTLKGL